jgi:hypothetical protein
MALIIDADVIIRGERGFFDLPAWLELQADNGPQVAAITVAELWHGVERATGPHKPRREGYLQMILEGLPTPRRLRFNTPASGGLGVLRQNDRLL